MIGNLLRTAIFQSRNPRERPLKQNCIPNWLASSSTTCGFVASTSPTISGWTDSIMVASSFSRRVPPNKMLYESTRVIYHFSFVCAQYYGFAVLFIAELCLHRHPPALSCSPQTYHIFAMSVF